MATLKIYDGIFDDYYFGRFFTPGAKGKILIETSKLFEYINPDGTLVIVRGTGFTYDVHKHPQLPGGHISSITVKTYGGENLINITQVSADVRLTSLYKYTFASPDSWLLFNTIFKGNDVITGSNRNDFITLGAGNGNDTIHAKGGDDWVYGDLNGNDHLYGDDGFDILIYSDYWTSHLVGASGVTIDAALGTATTPGGVDTFAGFEGYRGTRFVDHIYGSAANEDFAGFRGNDVIDGRGGFDTLWYFDDKAFGGLLGIHVDLSLGYVTDGFGTTDSVSNIEGVGGTDKGDLFIGGAADDAFWGLGGLDYFDGGSGGAHDAILFDDINRFGANHGVEVDLQLAVQQVINDGYDNVETAVNIEDVIGSQFQDILSGNGNSNRLYGDDGDDTLAGRGGGDALDGGRGDDSLDGGDGVDTLVGGRGADRFVFSVTPTNADQVVDFSGLNYDGDTIRLSLAVFSALAGNAGDPLTESEFTAGSTATAAEHRIIWDAANDDLFYDPDGSDTSFDKVLIAHFGNDPAIGAADIFLNA